jgi:PD-(D/E)XK nuclease superfamily
MPKHLIFLLSFFHNQKLRWISQRTYISTCAFDLSSRLIIRLINFYSLIQTRLEGTWNHDAIVLWWLFDHDGTLSFGIESLLVLIQVKASGTMKIPNAEVLSDWSSWVTGGNSNLEPENIFMTCVNGPVSAFATLWPTFMQATLGPKLIAKETRVKSKKTLERLYQVYLLGVLHGLRSHGWEVHVELHTGSGYTNICLISRKQRAAALIELKSSESGQQLERDADRALEQIVTKNYQNQYSLSGVDCIREYGMANFHLESIVKGRYLAWLGNSWQETDDPAQTA